MSVSKEGVKGTVEVKVIGKVGVKTKIFLDLKVQKHPGGAKVYYFLLSLVLNDNETFSNQFLRV